MLTGALAVRPAVADELDPARVAQAQGLIAFHGAHAAVEAGFTGTEIAAANIRQSYTLRNDNAMAKYENILGSDNFGGLYLEADGTLTVKYVRTKPALASIPDQSHMPVHFVQVDKTWDEQIAELDANPITGDSVEFSDPHLVHDRPSGGLSLGFSCTKPIKANEPYAASSGTSAGIVTWTEGTSRYKGILTAGHVVREAGDCGNETKWYVDDGTPGVYAWSRPFGHNPIDSNGNKVPGVWSNTTSGGNGRAYWLLYGQWYLTGHMDAGVVKIHKNSPGQNQVHLSPQRLTNPMPPWDGDPQYEYFKQVRVSRTPGDTLCVAFGEDSYLSEDGVGCYVYNGYFGDNTHRLDYGLGPKGWHGDSGSPVFDTNTPNPNHFGMLIGGIESGPDYGDIEFLVTTNILSSLANQFSEFSDIELCTQYGNGTWDYKC